MLRKLQQHMYLWRIISSTNRVFHLKIACHLHCDSGTPKVLLVGVQNQYQHIGNEEGFFIQAGIFLPTHNSLINADQA